MNQLSGASKESREEKKTASNETAAHSLLVSDQMIVVLRRLDVLCVLDNTCNGISLIQKLFLHFSCFCVRNMCSVHLKLLLSKESNVWLYESKTIFIHGC